MVRCETSLRMAQGCARINSRTRYSKNRLSRSPRGPSRCLQLSGYEKRFHTAWTHNGHEPVFPDPSSGLEK